MSATHNISDVLSVGFVDQKKPDEVVYTSCLVTHTLNLPEQKPSTCHNHPQVKALLHKIAPPNELTPVLIINTASKPIAVSLIHPNPASTDILSHYESFMMAVCSDDDEQGPVKEEQQILPFL